MTILLFIGEAYRFVIKHWQSALVLIALSILILMAVFIRGCYVDHEINKTQSEVTNTRIDEANKNAVTKTANVAVTEAKKVAQAASDEREKANRRDSKEYQNTNAGQRFCDRFPLDSSCVNGK